MASLTSLHQNITQSSIDSIGPKQTTIDLVGGILCNICQLTFATKPGYDSHYRSHGACTEIIYTCKICNKEIAGFPSFRGHCYTSHVIKDRFQCEHCLKQFSKISNLKVHVNRIHKFKCPTCRKEFHNKKEMLLHQIIHNGLDTPPYNCNTCKIEIDTAEECKEHVEKHLKFLYSCPICNDNISVKENAAEHMKKHFDDELSGDKNEEDDSDSSEDTSEDFSGIMCQFCSLILEDRVKFDAHFSCKHGDEDIVYMCVECGKSFEKYSVFKNHCYDHSLRSKHKCQICKKSFPRLSMLAAHTVACQGAGAARGHKVFACPECSRRFASMWRWREHLRVAHDMHRHLPCPHARCKRTFDTPKQLILHQQSHEIENQKFCSQCRFVFNGVASCERHIDVHRKKVYFCPICKRNAKDKKVILKHISQHFEVISHLCRVCGRIFNSKKTLIQHLKIHKKVKSYSCTHCTKSFVKPSQLEQHVNTHTGARPYKCPVCVKSFSNYPNWVKHVRRMHHEESIYIKNPIADQTDEDDSAMDTKVREKDDTKSINLFKNDIHTDNKKVNNNDQVNNTNEQVSHTNIEGHIREVQNKKTIDMIINEAISGLDEDSAMEVTVDEKYGVTSDFSKNGNNNVVSSTMEIAVDKKYTVSSDFTKNCENNVVSSTMDIVVDENYRISSDFTKNCNNNVVSSTDEQISYLEPKIQEVSHKIINIVIAIPDHTVNVEAEASAKETSLEKENRISTQNANIEQVSISDEQILNTPISSKPYKCPLCEKSFAKYSYMSKHVSRVHHIRSIDIKHLITDQKDSVDDEGSAVDTVVNDENEISSDNTKVDNDEQRQHITDKQLTTLDNHNSDSSKPFKCPICDKTFAKYPYMTKHVRKIHHKKSVDIKNSVTDHTAGLDEFSVMEPGVDEENEIFTGNTKEQGNIENFSRTVSHNHIEHTPLSAKPFNCPLCEKSFAKYPYMTKHVRKVHNKKNIDIKNPKIYHKESVDEEISAMETSVDGENDIFTDNIGDDNCTPNVEHLMSVGMKPYKCPTCEKYFAKHSYMSKHVRTVHNKKVMETKYPINDHKEVVDDRGSEMETVMDEENDISTDYSKDENDDRISNTDKQITSPENHMDIGYKPYKCPMCDKTFAQDRYCRKHVRRVHYKNGTDIRSPIFDHTQNYAVGTLLENEQQISKSKDYLNNEISNIDFIANIVNPPDATGCLNDIDDANASIDFANVRLENYMFSVTRDSPMDIEPSMPAGKYYLNENSVGNGSIVVEHNADNSSISKDLMYTNSEVNLPIVRELFNENGEAITVVEKDLFNGNSKESEVSGKDLYSANSGDNDNPIDILEYIAEMPENNSLFVPVIPQEALAPSAAPVDAVTYPCEYGPEFNTGLDAACTDGFIDLDGHMLPHIDPLLTINNQPCVQVQNVQDFDYSFVDAADLLAIGDEACNRVYEQTDQCNEYSVAVAAATNYETGWDPPILTKLCDQYAYGYGEMPEASRVPIMNTDIF